MVMKVTRHPPLLLVYFFLGSLTSPTRLYFWTWRCPRSLGVTDAGLTNFSRSKIASLHRARRLHLSSRKPRSWRPESLALNGKMLAGGNLDHRAGCFYQGHHPLRAFLFARWPVRAAKYKPSPALIFSFLGRSRCRLLASSSRLRHVLAFCYRLPSNCPTLRPADGSAPSGNSPA